MNVLSIQSHVAYGHVGNAAAVFAMQRLGVEVWPVHTVQFSNHTGYGEWTGRVFEAAMIKDLVEGIAALGLLGRCDGVLSGYLGAPDIGQAIVAAVRRVRRENPLTLYCCDPVIGDVGRGVFVRPGIAEFIRDVAVPAADIITPNHFELDYLAGFASTTLGVVKTAVQALHGRGPKTILVTSLHTEETPAGGLDLLACEGEYVWRLRTPKLALPADGAGDTIAALFLVHYARTRSVPGALSAAASAVFSLLRRGEEAGSRELLLVGAQDELARPTWRFAAERV